MQAKVPSGWLSVAVRSVRQKFISIIFSPIFLLEQRGESDSCIRGWNASKGDQKTSGERASDKNPFQYALAAASKDIVEKKRGEGLLLLEGSGSCLFISLFISLLLYSFPAFHNIGILPVSAPAPERSITAPLPPWACSSLALCLISN